VHLLLEAHVQARTEHSHGTFHNIVGAIILLCANMRSTCVVPAVKDGERPTYNLTSLKNMKMDSKELCCVAHLPLNKDQQPLL
jgi:hypothetical protein